MVVSPPAPGHGQALAPQDLGNGVHKGLLRANGGVLQVAGVEQGGDGGAASGFDLGEPGGQIGVLAQEGGQFPINLNITGATGARAQRQIISDLDDNELVLGGEATQPVGGVGSGVGGVGNEDHEAAAPVPGAHAIK